MKKILIFAITILFAFSSSAWGTAQWREDGSEETVDGGESPADLDTEIYNNIVQPLDRLLLGYQEGCEVSYASAATLTVGNGQVVVSNAAGTARLMLSNTSNTTLTWANIDTGAEAASTTYYVYAGTSTTTDLTFTVYVSTNATTPSSVTYYQRLGSFYNSSGSDILNDETITNDADYYALQLGDWVSKSNNTTYQASTDGFVTAYNSSTTAIVGLTDSSTPPTTTRISDANNTSGGGGIMFPVKKSDYYKTTGATVVYWLPNE